MSVRMLLAAALALVAPPVVAQTVGGVNVEDHLVRAWTTGDIPKSEEGQAKGAFRFLCASKDHRSHMAWTAQDGYGHAVCPTSHPYIVPQFTLASWYAVDATLADWFLASDRMPGMPAATPGTTLHSDWFGAWEDSVQARWTANCIEKMLSCSGGDLGDGSQLATAAGYDHPHGRPLRDPPVQATAMTMEH